MFEYLIAIHNNFVRRRVRDLVRLPFAMRSAAAGVFDIQLFGKSAIRVQGA